MFAFFLLIFQNKSVNKSKKVLDKTHHAGRIRSFSPLETCAAKYTKLRSASMLSAKHFFLRLYSNAVDPGSPEGSIHAAHSTDIFGINIYLRVSRK